VRQTWIHHKVGINRSLRMTREQVWPGGLVENQGTALAIALILNDMKMTWPCNTQSSNDVITPWDFPGVSARSDGGSTGEGDPEEPSAVHGGQTLPEVGRCNFAARKRSWFGYASLSIFRGSRTAARTEPAPAPARRFSPSLKLQRLPQRRRCCPGRSTTVGRSPICTFDLVSQS
jgi:hypothetical protein